MIPGASFLLLLSSIGAFCAFRACRLAYEHTGEVPVLWLVPLASNAALVMFATALMLGEVAR